MVRVKVCGMRSVQDIDICTSAGADALGFIFAAGPRRLAIDAAAQLTRRVPPFVTSVGVFAGNEAAFIMEALLRCRIDVLQFSGDEPPAFRGAFGKPTVAVVHASASSDPARLDELTLPDEDALRTARAVAVTIDSRVGDAVGGTGVRVSERIASALSRTSSLPFILAGGLTPDNVAEAVAAVRPWGVDVRSGVERESEKDRGLVERFVRAAKGAMS
jgi:phosphoribosylanthranilate isomerase